MSVVHQCTTKLLDRPFIMFCSTVRYIYVIARTPESTRKLPPRDLQDTVHIVYFYVVKVRSGIYRQFCSKKSTIQLNYHSTVAFSWRVASPPHRPRSPITHQTLLSAAAITITKIIIEREHHHRSLQRCLQPQEITPLAGSAAATIL